MTVFVLMEGVELRGVYSTRKKAVRAAREPGEYAIYTVPLDGDASTTWPTAASRSTHGDPA